MGQISLPVINRAGLYSHWSSSGDNCYNYALLFKQSMFLRLLLVTFLSRRLLLFNHIKLSTIYKLDQAEYYSPTNYQILIDLTNTITKQQLPFYTGKVLFLKYQNFIISIIYFFQPPKGEFKPAARLRNVSASYKSSAHTLKYFNMKNKQNPLFFIKNSF